MNILSTVLLFSLQWCLSSRFGGWSLKRLVNRRTSELRKSEKKYRELINDATEGIVIVVNMRTVYFNLAVKSIFDFSGEVTDTQLNLLDHINPKDHELILMKYHQFMEDIPVNSQLSFRIITAGGNTKWVRSNTVRIEWEGQPALLSFISDITEERNLEESIKTSEERYRLIFAQSPVGLFYYDTALKITNVNDRFADIMGSNRKQLQNFDLNNVTDTRIIDALKKVMTQENGYFEGRIKPLLSADQTELYIKLRTAPMLNEKREYQGGIGLLEDITEQIKNEHKIQNLENIFSKVFYTSTDAINITNFKTGKFIDINRGFTELSGYTKEEVIGKTSADINLWGNPEDSEKLAKGLLGQGECINLEGQFRCKNGEIHDGLMSASLIQIDGEVCIICTTRDIHEIKKSETLIRKSELRYRSIFESVPISIWEKDFTAVYDRLEELRNAGIVDLNEYLNAYPDFIDTAIESIKILDVNEVSLRMFKADSKEQLINSFNRLFNDESIENFKKVLLAIWNQGNRFQRGYHQFRSKWKRYDGKHWLCGFLLNGMDLKISWSVLWILHSVKRSKKPCMKANLAIVNWLSKLMLWFTLIMPNCRADQNTSALKSNPYSGIPRKNGWLIRN